MSNQENERHTQEISRPEVLRLFDAIPENRIAILDQLSNKAGFDMEVLRNLVEITAEDEEKIKPLAALLTTLTRTGYTEGFENEEIPETMRELIKLVK